jgi:hypothetical protein
MEISTIMSSSLQMQQAFAENTAVDEAGSMQSNAVQSLRFGTLLDQWTATGNGVRLPADLGRNDLPRAPFQGETFVECAMCGEQSGDPSQLAVQGSTDTFSTGVISTVIAAAAKIVLQLPEQKEPGPEGVAAEKEVNITQEPTPGEKGVPETLILETAHDVKPMVGKRLHDEENATNGVGELPVLPAEEDQILDCSLPEKPQEPVKETTGTDPAWTPLLALGNPFFQGNVAKPLPELPVKQEVRPSPAGGMATAVITAGATEGSGGQEAAGPILLQDNALQENQPNPPASQPDCVLQAAAGAATGHSLADTATSLPGEGPDSFPSSVIVLQTSLLQAAALYRDISPRSESASANSESVAGTTKKTGPNPAVPQTEGDIKGRRDIPLPPAEGISSKAVSASSTQAGASLQEPLPAPQATDPRGNGRAGESAGNAYRAVAAEAVPAGKNGALSMPDNLLQVKPGAMPDLTAANTAPNPNLIDIVFAEETGAERKEAGGEGIRKSLEGKTAGNETPTAIAPGSGELRVDRESRIPTPAADARVPLAEQIHKQIREKLDAHDNGSNNGRITLRLHPEELGELKINMRMEDQRLKVEIVTENQSVKDALMQNLDTLKETLSRQNIAMDRFNVSADLRQGFQEGARDGRQTTQENRGTDAGFRSAPATDEDAVTNLRYHWENENSLVNLVL